MSDKPTRKRKEENFVSRAIAMQRDNEQKHITINELKYFLESFYFD